MLSLLAVFPKLALVCVVVISLIDPSMWKQTSHCLDHYDLVLIITLSQLLK